MHRRDREGVKFSVTMTAVTLCIVHSTRGARGMEGDVEEAGGSWAAIFQ